MANKGSLFLIPNVIAEHTQDQVISPGVKAILPSLRFFLAEDIRTARRYLSSLKVYSSVEELHFSVLDKNTQEKDLATLMEPLMKGENMGVISESGCPGVADPGALAVRFAHRHRIQVVPLSGPSSIIIGLMASGLNGQRFAFQGYLPIDAKDCGRAIKDFERESRANKQTQIFIETPHRNNALAQNLLKNLHDETLLTIAVDLTGSSQFVLTRPVREWKTEKIELPKLPAVFLFLA